MIASQNGDLYVLGVSGSPNLGVSFNAYDTAFNGGSATFGGGQTFNLGTDIFVLRLDSLGSTKKGLTYFGGSGNDGINELGTLNYGDEARGEIVTTSTGVYIASSTNSLDFPQTLGVNYNGGQDGVLFKMSLDLDSLIWSSYYGGSNLDALFGLVAVESQNEDYLYSIGVSKSDSLADLGSFQPQRGGNEDAWIIRVNSNTGQLEKSSYFGGGDRDFGYLLSHNYLGSHKSVGDSNSLVFVGNNLSYIDSINTSWSQSNSSQHIVWVSKNLDSIIRVQTFGDGNFANQDLSPTALMLDDCGSLYFSGWGGITNTVGNTNTLFVTPNALQNGTDGNDFYFLVLGRDGYPLYASFFGGISNEHVDGGTSRFDPNGIIHQAICAGCGGNSNLPIFPHNAFSSTNGSTNCNMAAVQISFELQSVRLNLNFKSDTICENSLVELIGSTIRCDSTFISWGDGQTSFAHNPIGETHFYNQSGNYTISIVGFDTVCETSYTQNLNLFVSEPRNLSADVIIDYDLCDSSLFISLTPVDSSLGQIYKVFWGDGNDDLYINNDSIYHYYNDNYQPIDISVVAIDSICGLTDTNNFKIKFHPEMDEIEAEAFVNPCSSLPSIFFSGNSLNSTKLFWYPYGANTDTLVGTEVSWQVQTAGDYTVEVFAWDSICDKWISSSFTYSVVSPVIDSLKFPNVFTPNNDGLNDDFKVISTGIESIEIFNLEVFNRWGQKVFTTSDPNFLWDGSYRGRNLSSGVYFWIAKWKTVCGSKGNTTGDVLINTN
jgi:gliding motility-associated-like protein